MSWNSKSLLFLLQRCVAVRQLTLPSRTLLSGRCGFIQHRSWTSATRTLYQPSLCQFQATVRSNQHRFCTKTGESCVDDYPPLPAYQPDSEPEAKEVYIVQVKGIPWSCTAPDLLQFFSECRIRDGANGIHLTMDKLGRPSGQAFIEMEHEEDVSKALEKHRQYLGPRYVEVFEVTNSDAEVILKTAVETPAQEGVVLLRGLPFSCTESDIVQFFSGLAVVENGITFVTNSRGRRSGQAYVQFSSQEAADEALQRDRQFIGNRYVEVFPSRKDEICSSRMRTAGVGSDQAQNRTVSQQSSAMPLHYVHMRGLPFQVSGEDIVKFFAPLTVSKILIECGPDGKVSGEADVYFRSHQEAMAAMSRHRMNIGHRYIELFLNSDPDSDGR
ncbi:G-rich sequence factor 1 [Parambassis ranga]|uniref:G-rich sequence factor 1 n=1 Tax=Parambassis ranga TaxID=210632 RepID=A0A6P7IYH0_9TELE|nr:G-rich sequence factor 1 [Parambassis ranga]